jgi:tRNA pseudouridine38-40 synthase
MPGTHDFTAFTPRRRSTPSSPDRHARGWRTEGRELQFEIVADAFLRHQVRTLVGTMLQAARGERLTAPFADLLAARPARRRPARPAHRGGCT